MKMKEYFLSPYGGGYLRAKSEDNFILYKVFACQVTAFLNRKLPSFKSSSA